MEDLVYFIARVTDTSNTNTTRTTRVIQEQHKWDTTATRVLHERHKCDTSVIQVKNFDFDNDKSENIFLYHYSSYKVNERLQGQKQFHSKTAFWKCLVPCLGLKSTPQKVNFVMAKAIPKSYTLDCSCKFLYTFLHSYA